MTKDKYKADKQKAMEEGKSLAREPGGYRSMEELKKALLKD